MLDKANKNGKSLRTVAAIGRERTATAKIEAVGDHHQGWGFPGRHKYHQSGASCVALAKLKKGLRAYFASVRDLQHEEQQP